MRVVVDGLIFEIQSRGGISRLYTEILPRMCAMDDSLRIMLLTEGELRQPLPTHEHISHRRHIPIERVFRPYRLWAPAYPKLKHLVQRLAAGHGRGRLWHSTYYTAPVLWSGPTVVTVHDMIHERFSHLFDTPADERFRQLKRKCILAADKVICVSCTTERDVQELLGVRSERTQVVSHAYSDSFRVTEIAAEPARSPTRNPYLLYVGMRSHYKNFRLLLEAYSRWDRQTEVSLVTVGTPWSDEEMRFLESLGIKDQVHLFTDVDDERLCQLYNHAIASVYPSLYEGFGIPLLEAMACGCPIIASRIPSTVEVAQECPIYFEPTEPDDLIAAFNVAITEGQASERVRWGIQHSKCFSWDKAARQTLEVYRSVTDIN